MPAGYMEQREFWRDDTLRCTNELHRRGGPEDVTWPLALYERQLAILVTYLHLKVGRRTITRVVWTDTRQIALDRHTADGTGQTHGR
jgi:hypothetical protein